MKNNNKCINVSKIYTTDQEKTKQIKSENGKKRQEGK